MIALVNIRESLQECHKAQSCDPSFSIFLSMIYFLVLKNRPYVTTLMITHFTLRVMMQTLSLISCSRISRKYLFFILNPDNCYFLTLGFQDAQPNLFYNNLTFKNVSEENILGITIDNKLTFKSHLKNICKKANQKLNTLARNHPFKGKLC